METCADVYHTCACIVQMYGFQMVCVCQGLLQFLEILQVILKQEKQSRKPSFCPVVLAEISQYLVLAYPGIVLVLQHHSSLK